MELKRCNRIGLSIYGQPVLKCWRGGEKVLVVPTIQNAFQGKFVGLRDRIIEEAKKISANLLIRVENPKLEIIVEPSKVEKTSIKQKKQSKFSGYYEIYLYNISRELELAKQQSLF